MSRKEDIAMKKYLQVLEGITQDEWIKLRTSIDMTFESMERSDQKKRKLDDLVETRRILNDHFGAGTWEES